MGIKDLRKEKFNVWDNRTIFSLLCLDKGAPYNLAQLWENTNQKPRTDDFFSGSCKRLKDLGLLSSKTVYKGKRPANLYSLSLNNFLDFMYYKQFEHFPQSHIKNLKLDPEKKKDMKNMFQQKVLKIIFKHYVQSQNQEKGKKTGLNLIEKNVFGFIHMIMQMLSISLKIQGINPKKTALTGDKKKDMVYLSVSALGINELGEISGEEVDKGVDTIIKGLSAYDDSFKRAILSFPQIKNQINQLRKTIR
ncbi:MAG: hypothetical protein ABIB47_02340 [Candidatus Woesearchaeota archaeon]